MLITQPDHAALAGVLAEHWGNERFAVPAPRAALVCAAAHHDDGWHELDSRPMYNAAERRPAHFIELPLTDTVGPYGRGVESVYERDGHAGALVSMHFSGFYTSRWGVSRGGPSENPIARRVVAEQEALWVPALRRAWNYRGRRSEFDADNWHAYEVLQAVDLLSLAIGLVDLEGTAGVDAEPADLATTLGRVDADARPRILGGVPLAAGGEHVTLLLRVAGPGRLEVDPYPLDVAALEVSVPCRLLEDRPYGSEESAAEAFYGAQIGSLSVTLAAPAEP
jgi:hypothetical protein